MAFFALAVLGVALVALSPWIRSRVSFPDEPFDVSVMYRHRSGDIQYFPLISQLARGTITDGTIKETERSVFRSFPHATLLPHAISFSAFGKYGFPVADAIVAVAYFFLLVLFFQTLGVSRPLSTTVALFIALQVSLTLKVNAGLGKHTISLPLITWLWGMRIPRPFVSELYMLLMLVTEIWVLASRDAGRLIHWLALAGAFGLLVQGDMHAAMIFALSGPALVCCIARRQGLPRTLRGGIYSGLFLAAVISPFLLLRLFEHPDIPVRWGVFKVGRMAGFTHNWRHIVPQFWQAAFAMSLVYLVATRVRRQQELDALAEKHEPIRRVWRFTMALLLAAFACGPVSILILGKTIQPYHFDDRGSRLCSYVVIGFAVSWIDLILERLIKQSRFAVWRKPVIRRCCHAATLFLALSCVGYKLFSREASGFRSHLRDDYYTHTPQTRPSYRESFAELASFLESNVRHDSVIASFDDQLFSWWITFHRGYWFLVEPFVSSLPDDELESRLALLCKLLGMSSQEYVEFIQHEYINVFFLGCEKYQASQWHSYSPLDDYTDQQRQRILQSDDVWQVIIPQSELRRLKRQYENVTMKEFDKRALDVIVLSNSGPEDKWAPPANAWELIFENNGFRVYSRAK